MPIYEGKTVEEAIQMGLSTLVVTKDTARITILDEGKKGFLGLGTKAARVEIEPLETIVNVQETMISEEMLQTPKAVTLSDAENLAEIELSDEQVLTNLAQYLTEISQALNAPAVVTMTRLNNQTIVQLETEKQGLLIGKHGKTLNALQYLAQVYVHRLTKSKLSIVINVGDYREKREVILQRLAERTADKVIKTGRPIFLEPMPAFERKQIHAALSKNQAIQTHSEGDEPYRYLVVEVAKK